MDATHHTLSSLDAWPGETTRPPLRLLDPPRAVARRADAPAARPLPAGWLQRLRRAFSAA
jgi:hypothetical protein